MLHEAAVVATPAGGSTSVWARNGAAIPHTTHITAKTHPWLKARIRILRETQLISMGTCLDAPRRGWNFDSNVCVASTGPAADRQANAFRCRELLSGHTVEAAPQKGTFSPRLRTCCRHWQLGFA